MSQYRWFNCMPLKILGQCRCATFLRKSRYSMMKSPRLGSERMVTQMKKYIRSRIRSRAFVVLKASCGLGI